MRFWLPHSMDISTEPPHSPPTPRPWQSRSTVKTTAAEAPIVAYVGITPMRKVAIPMSRSVAMSVALRPIRSP